MKIRLMFYTLLLSATPFAFLANCSGKKNGDQAENHEKHAAHDSTQHASGSTSEQMSEPQFQVDASFQNQLASVFTSYIELKDAFVSSDLNKVKEEAKSTDEA